MVIKDFKNFFKNSLFEIYPTTEIDSFFFLLMEEYLDLQRIDTVLKPDFKIDEENLSILKKALERLQNEEPIQYIIGKTEFYSLPFLVDENTLIPRPETEELVEWVLEEVGSWKLEVGSEKLEVGAEKSLSILDIGTGSGCIPISLAKNLSKVKISAIDVSVEALKIAKKNATLHNVSIDFFEVDILQAEKLPQKFNIIISNPPYVRELEKVEIQNNVLQNEPHLALFVSDKNPLIFYDKIADLAKNHLTKNGLLFFEINQYLGKETCDLLEHKGFKNISLKKDLFGNDRMIKASL
ncbi:MAG: peptide chain release factor N(5)-glutamine methyltransferase [Flavobacteriales bacterium]